MISRTGVGWRARKGSGGPRNGRRERWIGARVVVGSTRAGDNGCVVRGGEKGEGGAPVRAGMEAGGGTVAMEAGVIIEAGTNLLVLIDVFR